MKNTKCPERKFCLTYKGNDCEGCAFGDEITKLHKRINRLKKQNETLTIQRNAWALTAKAMENKWIPVDERLPEKNYTVVLYCRSRCGTGDVKITGSYFQGHWWFQTALNTHGFALNEFLHQYDVTHWMPIPDLPRGVME